MSSAAAVVGSRAAAPGKGVVAPTTAQPAARSATPVADAALASGRGSRVALVVVIPIRAPSASSQARVNVEKYAAAGSRSVATIDHASDPAPMRQTAVVTRARQRTAVPRKARRATSTKTAGHTR